MAKKTTKKAKAPKAPKQKKAPKAPRQKVEHEEANGIVRPAVGTKTARVWELADALAKKGAVSRGDVMTAANAEGIPNATVATQFQRWRNFNNITERSPRVAGEPKAPKAPRAKKAKAPKAPAAAAA